MTDHTTAEIPVVVVSADVRPGQVQRLLRRGVRSYVAKPLDLQQFLMTIDEIGGTNGSSHDG